MANAGAMVDVSVFFTLYLIEHAYTENESGIREILEYSAVLCVFIRH